MTPYYQDNFVTVYNMDFFEGVKMLESESIDLVATDPPYESLNKWKGIGTTARMGLGRKDSKSYDPNKFYATITNQQLGELLQECYRLLKQNTHCYVMCDPDTLPRFYELLAQRWGLTGTPNNCTYRSDLKIPFSNVKPLVWAKGKIGMGYHYRRKYEFVMMLDKGKNRRLNDLSIGDVIAIRFDEKKLFPTQKPIRLFSLLISQSSKEGETVLEPFLGSGTTAIAAKLLNRKCIAFETKEKYCEMAVERYIRETSER